MNIFLFLCNQQMNPGIGCGGRKSRILDYWNIGEGVLVALVIFVTSLTSSSVFGLEAEEGRGGGGFVV